MERFGFVLTLGALTAVTATAIDICIPAQPDIALELGSDPAAGAALVGFFLLGYGPGQLFWGPLSDRFGRLAILQISLAGFLVASLVCALTDSFELLILGRMVEGLFAGGGPVISRAIARDQGGGAATAGLLSTMTVVLGAAPLVAPSIGSGLMLLLDWRSIFWFLCLFAAALIAASALVLPGSGKPQVRQTQSLLRYLRDAVSVLGARDFLVGTAVSASVFLGYAAFLSVGALVAQQRYGVSAAAFGPLFALAALAFVLGSILARQALKRIGRESLILAATLIGSLSGLGLLANAWAEPPLLLFWTLIGGYVLGFGMVLPVSFAKALEPAGHAAGAASSLMGTLQTLGGALGSHLVASELFDDAFQGLSLIMPAAMFLSFVLALGDRLLRPRR